MLVCEYLSDKVYISRCNLTVKLLFLIGKIQWKS